MRTISTAVYFIVLWMSGFLGISLPGVMAAGKSGQPDAAVSADAETVRLIARNGYLVGGEGRGGDSMQYEGRNIWKGPSEATVIVDERTNTGLVMGTVVTKGHTYTVVMNKFGGTRPFMSGGIAEQVYLHGLTGHGEPVLPKVYAYLAGWGDGCTVYKDAAILYDNFKCHFMVTEAVRNPETHRVPHFPDRAAIAALLKAKQEAHERGRETKQTEDQIREARGFVRQDQMQLHIIAHAPKRAVNHVPPYEAAVHFMWDEVEWQGRPIVKVTEMIGQQDWFEGPMTAADRTLKDQIERELTLSPYVDADHVEVRVRYGVAVLSGTVDDQDEARAAIENAYEAGAATVIDRLKTRDAGA